MTDDDQDPRKLKDQFDPKQMFKFIEHVEEDEDSIELTHADLSLPIFLNTIAGIVTATAQPAENSSANVQATPMPIFVKQAETKVSTRRSVSNSTKAGNKHWKFSTKKNRERAP